MVPLANFLEMLSALAMTLSVGFNMWLLSDSCYGVEDDSLTPCTVGHTEMTRRTCLWWMDFIVMAAIGLMVLRFCASMLPMWVNIPKVIHHIMFVAPKERKRKKTLLAKRRRETKAKATADAERRRSEAAMMGGGDAISASEVTLGNAPPSSGDKKND